MAKILCIDTSTEVCSVALSENGVVASIKEDAAGMNHSKMLTVFIDELLKENKLSVSSFDAIAVSEGPGSYTGLRIGVSAAKGLCFGAGIPLIAVSPLQAMTYPVRQKLNENLNSDDLLVPMIDARRMEVYCAAYTIKSEQICDTSAQIIDKQSFADELNRKKVYFFGNGAAKCEEVIKHPNAVFVENIITSADNMAVPAEAKFKTGNFVDVAYFEPFYLKNFIATKPKNNVLSQLIGNKKH